MTLEQLRTAREAGGVAGVILKGQGGEFVIHIATRGGTRAVLAKARSREPRRFGNPVAAFNALRAVGITAGQFDAREWNPAERKPPRRGDARAQALRKAHQAAAYAEWLAGETQDAIADRRPNLTHEEVMSAMDAALAALPSPGRRRTKHA